jgi:hypothetical protein
LKKKSQPCPSSQILSPVPRSRASSTRLRSIQGVG